MSRSPFLRVMMTTDTVGGVWTYATALSRALAAAGCEVALVTMGPKPAPVQRRSVENLPGVRLLETDLLLEWMDPAATDSAHAGHELGKLAQQIKPDVIHFNSFREAAFKWPAPVLVVAHSCVNSWADACDAHAAFAKREWRTYSEAIAAGLRRADAWVAPTAAFRTSISELYQPSVAGRVIWNGVEKALPRRRSRRPFVLGAGRVWDAAKNLTALASIARDLAWPVRIAGAGKSADGAAAGVELVDGVTWLGELSHASLLCEMREAEIFCSPARYEPFGLSVLEAASAGCALVLSDICSFRELWDGAALFVPPDDRQALARALISLSDNDDLRARLQHDARQRSLRYSLAQTAAQYHGLYTALIDRRLNAGAVGMPLELSA